MMRELFRRQFVALLHQVAAAGLLTVTLWHNMDVFRDRMTSASFGDSYGNNTYDFIIVGAGTSGAAVANRLSAHYNVLLLEAGGDPLPLCDIPGFALYILNYPYIDWMHKTVQQKHSCLALVNQESGWSQGKGLGGTSNLNFLIHSRGNPRDFDNWARLTNDPSWSYSGVLPFFKKSETFRGEYQNSAMHGRDGPMQLEITPEKGTGDVFVDAAQEFGYPKTDLNGIFDEGFDNIYYAIKKGRRQGSFNAYIKPIRRRRSLTIEKYAHVNKILMRGEENEAYGVEYDRHGKKKQAFSGKEVIIAAGAIQSPKLLMLSGIGPQDHLQDTKIKVKFDSPAVGQNLQDHISVYLGPFFVNEGHSYHPDRDTKIMDFVEYYAQGTGIVTQTGVSSMGFIASSYAKADGQGDWPDIQFIYGGSGIYAEYAKDFARGFHVREDILSKYYQHAVGKDAFFIITSVGRPHQRGQILLKSSDPYAPLHIDPRYLENERDIKVLIEGMKKAVEMVENSTSFQKIGGRFTTEPFPGCESIPFRSDAYWECFARQYTITLHHIVGTCAMGPENSRSVVNTKLQVRGARNLRVVDASIMPVVPVGNTNAPATMIGEKGADIILKQWGQSSHNPPRI